METYNDESSATGHDEPWIQWFCGLKGHEMFCEVERSYIEDGFNLYGLRAYVSNFSDCIDLILDRIGPDDSDDSHLTQNACTLYGLIHARYIITAHGLDAMYNKYAVKDFGICPLIQCNGQPTLPLGLSDEIGVDAVKIFCPKCSCVYHPPSRSKGNAVGACNNFVDGASFGTTFPHLFLMTFSNLVPDGLPPESAYVPRIFGFRVSQSARLRNENTGIEDQLSGIRPNQTYFQAANQSTSGSGTNGIGPDRMEKDTGDNIQETVAIDVDSSSYHREVDDAVAITNRCNSEDDVAQKGSKGALDVKYNENSSKRGFDLDLETSSKRWSKTDCERAVTREENERGIKSKRVKL
jgi:casein kinase II subunit beta